MYGELDLVRKMAKRAHENKCSYQGDEGGIETKKGCSASAEQPFFVGVRISGYHGIVR